MDRLRYPLPPTDLFRQAFEHAAPLTDLLSVFDAAHASLNTQLLCRQVGVPALGDAALGLQMEKFFTSAQIGLLPQLRSDHFSTLAAHQLYALAQQITEDKLHFGNPVHDVTMHLAGSIVATTLRTLTDRGQSHLSDFPRPIGDSNRHGYEDDPVYWSGTVDPSYIWKTTRRLDALIPRSLAEPNQLPMSHLLRAAHFCASASHLLVEPLRNADSTSNW